MTSLIIFAVLIGCTLCDDVPKQRADLLGDVVYETLKKDDLIPSVIVGEVKELGYDETRLSDIVLPAGGASRQKRRTYHHCPDTANIRVNGYTCGQFFALVGSAGCNDEGLKQHCCGTRRMYCETCHFDTPGITLNDKTCSELLKSGPAALCDHHQIIQHCCSSRAQFCPCMADVRGAAFYHPAAGSTTPTCANIFKIGTLSEQCKHPNLWEKCCKTRMNFCSAPPEGAVGR